MASKSLKTEKAERNKIFEDNPMNEQRNEDLEPKTSTIENIISVILGIAVVIVIGAMVINVIRNRETKQTTNNEEKQEQATAEATISARHVVQEGETLWGIAEKYYNDGFKYKEILNANNLQEGSRIEKGQELVIPKLEKDLAQGATTPSATPASGPTGPTGKTEEQKETILSASSDKQYTVVRGDTLWDICVKHYNNGYKWVEVARANNLKNPHLIHAGNVLILP